jgi:hypothetical protein
VGSISSLWETNSELFKSKKIQQIISFAGEGTLKDNNQTSIEFRELLSKIPSELLYKYINECLSDKFDGSGLVLQDLVNQVGSRLGFQVKYGRYRGTKNAIGYDGIWTSKDQNNIIIEVKTTDAYRINLNDLAKYRTQLIEQKEFTLNNSSILIVVGREDTGDLESQIRGSHHSMDIRLIGADALWNLLSLKENLNDAKTSYQINSILRPIEYLKIDRLVELISTTAKDFEMNQVSPDDTEEVPQKSEDESMLKDQLQSLSTDFYGGCIELINSKLKIDLIKQTRTSYMTADSKVGLVLTFSKSYIAPSDGERYWYSIYQHHRDFLKDLSEAYIAFGCGSIMNLFLIKFEFIDELLPYMSTSTKSFGDYWHIFIYNRDGKFTLRVPRKGESIDLEGFKVK